MPKSLMGFLQLVLFIYAVDRTSCKSCSKNYRGCMMMKKSLMGLIKKARGKLGEFRDKCEDLQIRYPDDCSFLNGYFDDEALEEIDKLEPRERERLSWNIICVLVSLCSGTLELVGKKNETIGLLKEGIKTSEDRLYASLRCSKTRPKERILLAQDNGCSLEQIRALALYELDALIAETAEEIDNVWGSVELSVVCMEQARYREKKALVANATDIETIISAI